MDFVVGSGTDESVDHDPAGYSQYAQLESVAPVETPFRRNRERGANCACQMRWMGQ